MEAFSILQLLVYLDRALFFTGISFGSFKVGASLGLIFGSVITFNNDVVNRKENGLLFCYVCDRQIDPKAKSPITQTLDKIQTLIGFPCETCKTVNYFPVPKEHSIRAKLGHIPYGSHKVVGIPAGS